MSELKSKVSSNAYTIIFMVILSFICALILSVLASALAKPQELAKDLNKNKEMMIAAKIYNPLDYFQLPDGKGGYVPAKFSKDGILIADSNKIAPTKEQILEVYKKRLKPFLVDDKGNKLTFQEAKIDETAYLNDFRKRGYYTAPYKLIYEIRPNSASEEKEPIKAEGYVIPVNGYGLWAAIYGFLAIKPDADTVIGISWYDQKETPGLGANIAETPWQNLFPGKLIFQPGADGKTDFKTAPLGIVVARGKVSEVFGDNPKAKSAVDGMAGATLTGNGVTKAYQDVLAAYRPFLLKLHAEEEKKENSVEKK